MNSISRPVRPIRTSYEDEKQFKHDLLVYTLACLLINQAELMRADGYESLEETKRRQLSDYDRRPEIILRMVTSTINKCIEEGPSGKI